MKLPFKIPKKLDPSILSDEMRREIAEMEARRIEYRAKLKQREPSRGARLDDGVLGPLKWDGTEWEGAVSVPPFGKMMLTLAGPGKGVSDAQRKTFKRFCAKAQKLHTAVGEANFKYFERARPELVEDIGAEFVPVVKSVAALWKELGEATLHIPRQGAKSWRVVISWPCSWDPEHGHSASIRDGKVERVGMGGDD